MANIKVDDSIFLTIKKLRGVDVEDDAFDTDLRAAINSALSILTQIGVGPEKGFMIVGNEDTWSDLTDDEESLAMIVNYVDMRVHLMFDPPSNSFLVTEIKESIKELECRINIAVNDVTRSKQ